MTAPKTVRNIMAVDCCEHTLAALRHVRYSHTTSITSNQLQTATDHPSVDLIVIGVAQFPMRRLLIGQLRCIYQAVPALILRREAISPDVHEECIRGEFILGDRPDNDDFEVVRAVREMLPLGPCEHTFQSPNHDIVREVIRIMVEKYPDPRLDLDSVADELPVSSKRLSRILNEGVGISFRQLLRNVRIEEAKRMLASRRYIVKEVAMRVGFSDSHYFSRSFKELTGLRASEFRSFRSYAPLTGFFPESLFVFRGDVPGLEKGAEIR